MHYNVVHFCVCDHGTIFHQKNWIFTNLFFCLLTTKIVLLRYVIYKSLADHNKYIAF